MFLFISNATSYKNGNAFKTFISKLGTPFGSDSSALFILPDSRGESSVVSLVWYYDQRSCTASGRAPVLSTNVAILNTKSNSDILSTTYNSDIINTT